MNVFWDELSADYLKEMRSFLTGGVGIGSMILIKWYVVVVMLMLEIWFWLMNVDSVHCKLIDWDPSTYDSDMNTCTYKSPFIKFLLSEMDELERWAHMQAFLSNTPL